MVCVSLFSSQKDVVMREVRFLLVYYANPLSLLTIEDNVQNFQQLSENRITLLNTYPAIKIPHNIQLAEFHGILIDSTLAYFPQTLRELDDNLTLKLADYEGVKVLFKQDEHIHSHETARIIGEKKIDLVFSCLDPSQVAKVYLPHLVGNARIVQQYTGYFSDNLINLASAVDYARCIDLSYRGSMQPLQCGRLGYEKWNIGYRVKEQLNEKNFCSDISFQWSDRIHGKDWIKFLSCSKAVLGVESGSNLFDFNGEVEKKCRAFDENNAALRSDPQAYYDKAEQEFLCDYENNVKYAQISPRHFEAAATRTLQILYEGEYSDILIPYQHYLPLKRDLSNLEEIIEVLLNAKRRQHITDCAYEEIVMNEKYHYRKRVEYFDTQVEKIIAEKKTTHATPNPSSMHDKKNIIILVPHATHLDPRITWLKQGFDDFANACVIGTTELAQQIPWQSINEEVLEANLNYSGMPEALIPYDDFIYKDYYNLIRILEGFCSESGILFPESSFFTQASLVDFRWYCNYFRRTEKALRFAIEQLILGSNTVPDLLVCSDLPTLLSGVILSQKYGIPLVYDAHEFWAYNDIRNLPWETDFWLFFEKLLLKYVDLPVTVSEGLANKMGDIYEKAFLCVPNTELVRNVLPLGEKALKIEPLLDDPGLFSSLESEETVTFLFLGQYAQGRGLEQLIDAWKGVHAKYKLILRGPHREYTDMLIARAKALGLYNKTVFFFKAVKETELIATAADVDVGIIPYSQNTNLAYKYCCPNKLSQYMAAGIPILSNQLTEVAKVIEKAQCGMVVDFDEQASLIEAIHRFGEVALRQKMGKASREYFLNQYNWEKKSEPLYAKSRSLMYKNNKSKSFTRLSTNYLPVLQGDNITEISSEFTAFERHEILGIAPVSFDRLKPIKLFLHPIKYVITRKIKIFNPMLRKIKQKLYAVA